MGFDVESDMEAYEDFAMNPDWDCGWDAALDALVESLYEREAPDPIIALVEDIIEKELR